MSLQSENFAVNRARLGDPAPAKVYVAGGGRRGIELAAETADGFLAEFGRADERYLRWLRRTVPCPIVVPVATRVTDDPDSVLPAFKQGLAYDWSIRTTDPFFELVGIDPELRERVRALTRMDEVIAGGGDPLEDLADADMEAAAEAIPDRQARALMGSVALVGPPEACAERLDELAAAGVDGVLLHTSRFDETVAALPAILSRRG